MPILHIKNIEKTFRQGFWGKRNQVLKGVDLSLEQGEVYGFLGHNGAGKSTTMKIIMGLLRPDAGTIELFGTPEATQKDRYRIGYLSEEIGLYPYLNAAEMLTLTGELFRMSRSRMPARIDELLVSVGLDHKRDVKIKHYSKGMRQRLGVAAALMNDPDLLLLDEPYSGLDPVGRKDLRKLLLDLKGKGKTIMLSSHIVPDVEAVCDRVGILSEGVISRVLDLNDIYRDRTNDVEVVLSGVPAGRINARDYGGEEVHRDDRICIIRCSGDDRLRSLVNDAYDAGGSVVGVRQVKLSLEDIFVKELERRSTPRTSESTGELVGGRA